MGQADYYENYLMFNPSGDIKQLEYAFKATQLGNISVAMSNKKEGVIIAYVRPKKLAEPLTKIYEIAPTTLFTFAGITNDGLSVKEYLSDKVTEESVIKDREIHPIEGFKEVSKEASYRSLTGGKRLLAVNGVLLTQYNNEICLTEYKPSGEIQRVYATAIGHMSETAKTTLKISDFMNCTGKCFVRAGIAAIKKVFSTEDPLLPSDLVIRYIKLGESWVDLKPEDYF